MSLGEYSKFIVAIAAAVVSGLVAYYGEDTQLVQTVIAVLSALGVYSVSNEGV